MPTLLKLMRMVISYMTLRAQIHYSPSDSFAKVTAFDEWE